MRLIDADAYMEKVCTYKETGCGCCVYQSYCPVDEPTIEAKEVVHGEWITDNGVLFPVYRCSECNCATALGKTKFCPNCGSKMKG